MNDSSSVPEGWPNRGLNDEWSYYQISKVNKATFPPSHSSTCLTMKVISAAGKKPMLSIYNRKYLLIKMTWLSLCKVLNSSVLATNLKVLIQYKILGFRDQTELATRRHTKHLLFMSTNELNSLKSIIFWNIMDKEDLFQEFKSVLSFINLLT